MKNLDKMHNIIMESREKISITGVLGVDEFDENTVTCKTNAGNLVILGENLHVEKLDLEQNELNIIGYIKCVEYEDKITRGSIFSKLFK